MRRRKWLQNSGVIDPFKTRVNSVDHWRVPWIERKTRVHVSVVRAAGARGPGLAVETFPRSFFAGVRIWGEGDLSRNAGPGFRSEVRVAAGKTPGVSLRPGSAVLDYRPFPCRLSRPGRVRIRNGATDRAPSLLCTGRPEATRPAGGASSTTLGFCGGIPGARARIRSALPLGEILVGTGLVRTGGSISDAGPRWAHWDFYFSSFFIFIFFIFTGVERKFLI